MRKQIPINTPAMKEVQPQQFYLLCATPRCGSTYLCEALTGTGLAGKPDEHFFLAHDDEEFQPSLAGFDDIFYGSSPSQRKKRVWENISDYFMEVMTTATTANGVFGSKLMWGYANEFICALYGIDHYRSTGFAGLLAATFPHARYLFITRRDKVRQAISLWKAVQTRVWLDDPRKKEEMSQLGNHALNFDFEKIERLRLVLLAQEVTWQAYFQANHIQPLLIVYEDFITAYEATLLRILYYLHIRVPEDTVFTLPTMKQQADALSEQWLQQYYQTHGSQRVPFTLQGCLWSERVIGKSLSADE